MTDPRRLLILDSDPVAAATVRSALADSGSFDVEWLTSLADGLVRLAGEPFDAVVLSLALADSRGIETIDALLAAAPGLPVLLLATPATESIAQLGVQHGAQEYLLTSQMDAVSVTHAVTSMIHRRIRQESLFIEQARASVTLESIGDAVLSTDCAGLVTYLNAVAEGMTGWSRAEAHGRPVTEVFRIIDSGTRHAAVNPVDMAIREDTVVGLAPNTVLVRRDGVETAIEDSTSPIQDRSGRVTGAVVVFRDVSQSREMVQHIEYLAHHDALTDLPNRLLLLDRISQAIVMARRHGTQLAVLFLDLDRFKLVNDSLGHAVGDQLLRMVADRLTTGVRQSDTVSRLAGDEFVVLLTDLTRTQNVADAATKILASLGRPYVIDTHVLHVPASIGASTYPEDGEDAETLIQHADTAMYAAKESGRNVFQFFTEEMSARANERRFIETGLRRALARGEFCLHYQPKIRLSTGAITGVEALLRWRHPDRGLIPPHQFVSIAEENGLILPIGQWVLREACRQARLWEIEGLGPMPVSVNVSAVEFRHKHYLRGVRTILADTRLDPRLLELELTETALMSHADSTTTALHALKALGVQLAVDDFGTGYSSLSHLRTFPVDVLKIDRSFVHEISTRPDDAAIVNAVVGMGATMKKRVIAEGVETQAQFDFLHAHGCNEAQGFYFHEPMAAEQLALLLTPSAA
jgi:diguanylate cyclase (GGDEF)-like protein/PAS domain S-box-containing protein